MANLIRPRFSPESFETRPLFRFYHVTENLYVFALLAHIFLLLLFIGHNVLPMAVYNIISIAVFLSCLVLNRSRRHYLAYLLGSFEVLFHAILASWFVGVAAGFHLTILTLAPCMFLLPFKRSRFNWLLMTGVVMLFIGTHFLLNGHTAPYRWRRGVSEMMYLANVIIISISLSLLTYYLTRASWAAENYISYLIHIDPLTGVLNRRGMEEAMRRAMSSFGPGSDPVALMICDIDDFKQLNDTRGHDYGDRILTSTADRMKATLRSADAIGRWGGEEFLILLPGTQLSGAEIAARKLIAAVAEPHSGDDETRVTITVGVTTVHSNEPLSESLKRADAALYRGKLAGKNRVVVEE